MTTNEAFKELTAIRGWYALCGINESTARSHKQRFREGKLSPEKIFQLLEAAGYEGSERTWNKKKVKEPKK
jgi:hypothetical protein